MTNNFHTENKLNKIQKENDKIPIENRSETMRVLNDSIIKMSIDKIIVIKWISFLIFIYIFACEKFPIRNNKLFIFI